MPSSELNSPAVTTESPPIQWEDDEINLLDYWIILRRNWRVIALITFFAAFVSGIWSLFFIPRKWEATTRILLPQQLQGAGVGQLLALPGAGGGGGGLAALVGGGANLGDTYKAILESDFIRLSLVHEFNLDRLLHLENREAQIKSVGSILSMKIDPKSGMISISGSLAGTPQGKLMGSRHAGPWGRDDIRARTMSAQIVNRSLELLQQYLTDSNIFQSQKYRKYMEEQADQARLALRLAQGKLEAFQRTSKIVSPSDEVKALIDTVTSLSEKKTAAEISSKALSNQIDTVTTQLKTQAKNVMSLPANSPVVQQWRQKLIEQETELAILQKELTESHPDVRKQKLAIEETEKQLTKEVNRVLKSADEKLSPQLTDLVVQQISAESQDRALSSVISNLQSELSSLPPKMMTYSQLKGDAEVAERRYRMLAEELENAKMSAAKEPTGFVLLDSAVAPEKKSSPSSARNVMLAILVGLMVSVMLVLAKTSIERDRG